MGVVFVILASLCLSQGMTYGHSVVSRQASNPVLAAAQTAYQRIGALVNGVVWAVIEANRLIHKYSDNSTDYAAEFRNASQSQINALVNISDKALAEASNISGSNINVLDCFTSKRDETQLLAQNVISDVSRCAITKARQFSDLAITVGLLANSTFNLIPNMKAKIKSCDYQPNDMFKIGCITWVSAETSATVTEIGVSVSANLVAATNLFATFQSDLELCAQARLLGFRKRVAEIPLAIGTCTSKTILG